MVFVAPNEEMSSGSLKYLEKDSWKLEEIPQKCEQWSHTDQINMTEVIDNYCDKTRIQLCPQHF